jgi:ligand-binding sensor domain-containing protein
MQASQMSPSSIRRKRRALAWIGLTVCIALLLYVRWRHRDTVTPDRDSVFTSTRYVTSLAVMPDGTLWAGTLGGVLRRDREGAWEKFTRRDGLPSHEVQSLEAHGGVLQASFPRAMATWRSGRWQSTPGAPPVANAALLPGQTCATTWRGAPCVATVQGLCLWEKDRWRRVPLPPSNGTHISALLPHRNVLWAALFGDGLWAFDGQDWQPLSLDLPQRAREITALAEEGETLWIGTRREGLWQGRGRLWIQHVQHQEPVDHNCQALAMFDDRLFVSTLEDGLAVRTRQGWGHFRAPTLSSNAPRQMVRFGDTLYLRHGSGKVDAFDGKRWKRDVCAGLPRTQATALAADAARLYVAQWGGWSEFDGKTWTHHLNIPELQGLVVTALCPEGDTLWLGTQRCGVARVNRVTGRLRWHDERNGLPDDWVTAIARGNGTLYTGTFIGGLARLEGTQWSAAAQLRGESVTALTPDASGGLYVATRSGVWRLARDGSLTLFDRSVGFLDHEAQALCRAPGGLWVGTRTGLFFLCDSSLRSGG